MFGGDALPILVNSTGALELLLLFLCFFFSSLKQFKLCSLVKAVMPLYSELLMPCDFLCWWRWAETTDWSRTPMVVRKTDSTLSFWVGNISDHVPRERPTRPRRATQSTKLSKFNPPCGCFDDSATLVGSSHMFFEADVQGRSELEDEILSTGFGAVTPY